METLVDIGWIDVGSSVPELGEPEGPTADEAHAATDALLIIELI